MIKKTIFLFIVFLTCSYASEGAAQEECSLVVKSEYFKVCGYKGMEVNQVLEKIKFRYFLHFDDLDKNLKRDPNSILAKTLDALFFEVSDILGVNVFEFNVPIYFLPDQPAVSHAFEGYFKRSFAERSFYLHEQKILYISTEDLTLGMLGHEIAHAILSHYFTFPPPLKIQEVLSGYVEFTLNKAQRHQGTKAQKR